jgi:hypothetical protein
MVIGGQFLMVIYISTCESPTRYAKKPTAKSAKRREVFSPLRFFVVKWLDDLGEARVSNQGGCIEQPP